MIYSPDIPGYYSFNYLKTQIVTSYFVSTQFLYFYSLLRRLHSNKHIDSYMDWLKAKHIKTQGVALGNNTSPKNALKEQHICWVFNPQNRICFIARGVAFGLKYLRLSAYYCSMNRISSFVSS